MVLKALFTDYDKMFTFYRSIQGANGEPLEYYIVQEKVYMDLTP